MEFDDERFPEDGDQVILPVDIVTCFDGFNGSAPSLSQDAW